MGEANEQAPRYVDRPAVVLFLTLLLVALIPAWVGPVTLDYPMHIARAFIMAQPQDGTGVSEFYKIDIQPVPNLGMDFLVSSLIRFLPVQVSSTIFITLVVVLIASGSFALSTVVHKRVTVAAFLPLLALYDQWFLMGFANYLFGLGLGLWAVALWIYLADTGRRTAQLAMAILMSALLIVCHLMAFLVTVAIVLLIEIGKHYHGRALYRASIVGSLLLCAAILFVSTIRGRDYWGLTAKIEGTMQIVTPTIDPVSWLAVTVPVIVLALMVVTGRLGLKLSQAQVPLVFLTLFFIGPTQLAGTAFTVERLSLPLMITFLAFIAFGGATVLVRQSVFAVFTVMLAIKIFVTSFYFLAGREALSRLLADVAQIPSRATIFTVDMGLPNRPPWRAVHQHILNLATVDKPRLVAQLFTRRLQQPIVFNDSVAVAKLFQGNNPLEVNSWTEIPDIVQRGRFVQSILNARGKPETEAFLVVFRPKSMAPTSATVPQGASVVSDGDFYTIFRIER
jgi:hypothetical protein